MLVWGRRLETHIRAKYVTREYMTASSSSGGEKKKKKKKPVVESSSEEEVPLCFRLVSFHTA